LVAFHPLKRGLHDLIAETVVVRLGRYDKDKIEELADPKKTKKAYLAVPIVGVLVISGWWMLFGKIESPTAYITQEELVALKAIETEIEDKTVFKSVAVTPVNAIFTFHNGETEREIRVTLLAVAARISPYEDKPINLQKAVSLILRGSTYLANYDCINFLINQGFNIGIVSSDYFSSYEITPAGHPVEITSNMVRIPPHVGGPGASLGCHVEREAIGDLDPSGAGYKKIEIVPMVPRP
jgi:hypothetical protein